MKLRSSVTAIIVTYNRLPLLKQCLKCLLLQSIKLNQIIVINNDSTDGTAKFLRHISDKHPIIKHINMHENLGGAGGFSLGTKIAFKYSDSNYFWLMDDDTLPAKTALSWLIHSSNTLNNKFGYLCSNVRWWRNHNPSYLNVPIVSNDWNDKLDLGLVKTISASFVSLFVPRFMVKKVGFPIADMFIWGDDVEYTTRLSREYNSYLVSNSIVFHKSKSNAINETIYNVPISRLIYYKCMFRNRLYIGRKYYKKSKVIKLLIKDLVILSKVMFVSHNHRIKRFLCVLEGLINGLLFSPKIQFPDFNNMKRLKK